MIEPLIQENRQSLFDFDAELDLPVTHDHCVIFPLDRTKNEFNLQSGLNTAEDIIRGKPSLESTFKDDIDRINDPKHLTPPWLIYRIFINLVIGFVLMLAILIFTIIWFMTILDLVLLAIIIWILRKLFIILWLWREAKIAHANFPGLARYIKQLNVKYEAENLKWTLDKNRHWLQLGQKAMEHQVFR